MKVGSVSWYRWFLSMEFVIRRWIFVSKGGLGIVQFGNGIGSLAFLLVMENRHILFLSLFNCERFEVFSNILNLHSTFLSFFFFSIYHPRVFPPLLRKLWVLISEDSKIFFHTSNVFFFFFNKLHFVTLISRHYREPDNWGSRRNNALRFHNTTREAYSCGYKDYAESSIKSNQWALCGRPIWLLIHLSLLEARPSCQTSHLLPPLQRFHLHSSPLANSYKLFFTRLIACLRFASAWWISTVLKHRAVLIIQKN